jgi:hypothetical protein
MLVITLGAIGLAALVYRVLTRGERAGAERFVTLQV